MDRPHVLFVVLDAFPYDGVDADVTPVLYALAAEGAHNPMGGIGDLTAATYPNHASFVTGVPAHVHGIMANNVRCDGQWVKSAMTGPQVPTLFDHCRRAGRSSAAIFGDQYLVGVCGAEVADTHWPPKGVLPADAPRGITGYGADRAVIDAAASADLDVDFAFVQLDEVDSVRHMCGATSSEAREQCHATDAALGSLVEVVRHRWDNTVMCIVSDHDQEDLSKHDPIDLSPLLEHQLVFQNQGTAALIVGSGSEAALAAIDGVAGMTSLDAQHRVVWGGPGRAFGMNPSAMCADHGSPRTRGQLAVVAGGHPRVPELARRLVHRRPRPSDWTGWIGDLLSLSPSQGHL